MGFGSVCLEKRGLHVSEARQRIMGEWEGDKKIPLEVERRGARGVQEGDQRGRKARHKDGVGWTGYNSAFTTP